MAATTGTEPAMEPGGGGTPGTETLDTLYAGELEIRTGDRLVLAAGQPLTLSVREFQLLLTMVRMLGKIATREQLYADAWGGRLRAGDRSVDVYVSRLREKLRQAVPDRHFIHTHPGFGYRLQPSQAGASGPGGTGGGALEAPLR